MSREWRTRPYEPGPTKSTPKPVEFTEVDRWLAKAERVLAAHEASLTETPQDAL